VALHDRGDLEEVRPVFAVDVVVAGMGQPDVEVGLAVWRRPQIVDGFLLAGRNGQLFLGVAERLLLRLRLSVGCEIGKEFEYVTRLPVEHCEVLPRTWGCLAGAPLVGTVDGQA
jgi:hypothetical protein